MKKLIALLLAVSALTMSTSVFAYDAFDLSPIGTAVGEHTGVSRNYAGSSNGTVTAGGTSTSGVNYGSPVFRATSMGIAYLPTYRSGDVLTFAILPKTSGTATPVNEGDKLTFICSKQDDTTYENSNVQMIDQLTLSPTSGSSYTRCTYKLRDNLEDGRYKLEMRLEDTVSGTVISNTYSFLIATPSVELLYVNEIADGATPAVADKYYLRNGDAYCFGKATITGGANFSQVDTDFGFLFDTNNDGTYETSKIMETTRSGNNLTADADYALQASITNGNNQEIGGEAQYFFRMVIEDVYDYTYGVDLTEEETAAAYAKLPDVDVYLND